MSIEQGFAIRRNGSCLAGIEVGCGATANGMVGCCPNGFQCPQSYNIDCCPAGKNCTMEIVQTPRCSNSSWDLYDNGGYFCCEHGRPAYNNSRTNICASPGSAGRGILLELVQAGSTVVSSSILPSVTSTSISTSSPASTTTLPAESSAGSSTPQDKSSTPVGAIAGGVVGGVAGLAAIALVAWFLIRRKRQVNVHNPYLPAGKAEVYGGDDGLVAHQLDNTQIAQEVDGGKVTYAHRTEMPAQTAPVELPAGHHMSR